MNDWRFVKIDEKKYTKKKKVIFFFIYMLTFGRFLA